MEPIHSDETIMKLRRSADLLDQMTAAAQAARQASDELDRVGRQYDELSAAYRDACVQFEEAARQHREALQSLPLPAGPPPAPVEPGMIRVVIGDKCQDVRVVDHRGPTTMKAPAEAPRETSGRSYQGISGTTARPHKAD